VSHDESGGGMSTGCVVGAIVAGVLLLGAVVVVILAMLLMRRRMAVQMPMPSPSVTITTDVAKKQPPKVATPEAADSQEILVKLTGTGDGGTWYMVEDEIHEGDDALKQAIKEHVAEAKKSGKKLHVRLAVIPDAGITAKAVAAAAQACIAAGAAGITAPGGGAKAEEASK